jgi:predicted  nucleic acid-binding Zn-ribbon protein
MSRAHELEMKFQQGIHQADLVNRDEDARRYKLRALSLRDENANLKDKITHQAGQLSLLKKQVIRLQSQLEDASGASSTLDARIKKQADENGRLKVSCRARAFLQGLSLTTLRSSLKP